MEEQLKEVMEQLKYYNIKWIKDGIWIKFQIYNKQNKVVTDSRWYVEDNFNPKSKWYSTTEKMVGHIIMDYRYVVSYRLDCQ